MLELRRDQASGLRRLFRKAPVTRIAFAGGAPRGDGTALALACARALRSRGFGLMLIDERTGPGNALGRLRQRPRYDLIQALERSLPLPRVCLPVGPSLMVAAASRLAARGHELDAGMRQALVECMGAFDEACDVMIIDMATDVTTASMGCSALAREADHVVVTVRDQGKSMTESYALIKQVCTWGEVPDVHVVVAGPMSSAAAHALYGRFAETVGAYLGMRPHWGGHMGPDVDASTSGPDMAASQVAYALAEKIVVARYDAPVAAQGGTNRWLESTRSMASCS